MSSDSAKQSATGSTLADEDCFFQVMLGNPRPSRPLYQDAELLRLQAEDDPDADSRQ
jgi:hypothetical protein